MLKKVIPLVLVLCLIFSISVMAENTTNTEDVPPVSGEMPQGGMPDRGTPPSMPRGERPQGNFDPSQMPQGGFDPSQMPEGGFTPPTGNNDGEMPQGAPDVSEGAQTNEGNEPAQEDGAKSEWGNGQFGGRMPGGMGGFPGDMQNLKQQSAEEKPVGFWGFVKTYSTPIISVALLALAFIFVIFYRRKNY